MPIKVNKELSGRCRGFKNNFWIFLVKVLLREVFYNKWNRVHQFGQLRADFAPRQASRVKFKLSVSDIRYLAQLPSHVLSKISLYMKCEVARWIRHSRKDLPKRFIIGKAFNMLNKLRQITTEESGQFLWGAH